MAAKNGSAVLENSLRRYIFDGYDPEVMPRPKSQDALAVNITIFLQNLIKVVS